MQKEKAPLGLYIHIPFCRQKCAYCDFYSLPRSEEKMDAYTAALLRHIEEVAPRTAAHRVDTVYFGGGTPQLSGTGPPDKAAADPPQALPCGPRRRDHVGGQPGLRL